MATWGPTVFTQDCYVSSLFPNTNYNLTHLTLSADDSGGKTTYYMVIFATVDLSGAGITYDQVTAAVCKMYLVEKVGTLDGRWSRNTGTWDEATLTYNTIPGQSTPASDTVSIPTTGQWVSWDIKDQVADALQYRSGLWNASLWVQSHGASENSYCSFWSSEYTTDTSLRPYVEITYTPPAGGAPKRTQVIFI